MFGYILVNPKTLSKDEKARYHAAYCGLCRQLREYGPLGRSVLSYDMTFIALLLHSVYCLDEERGFERCVMRPATPHSYFVSEATEYAADMNVLFAYYDALDDWHDEHDRRALARSVKLGAFLPAIRQKWPAQAERAAECLESLSLMERQNVLNPDEPANCFGALLGEIFDWRGESSSTELSGASGCAEPDSVSADTRGESAETRDRGAETRGESAETRGKSAEARDRGAGLRAMGEALGRFIYLLDASNDLHSDIKHERYNPLIAQDNTDFEPLLTMLIGECTREFEKINPECDAHILRNVLYSGVWMKYRNKRRQAQSAESANENGEGNTRGGGGYDA